MSWTFSVDEVNRDVAIVNQDGNGIILSESDLIEMLAALQDNDAYTPEPRTGEL